MRFSAAGLFVFVCLFGCAWFSSLPTPIVEPPAVHTTTATEVEALRTAPTLMERSAFFDLASFIRVREETALLDFLHNAPKTETPKIINGKEYPAPTGEVWGWKGVYNTNGYGLGEWVRRAAHYYNCEEAFPWLRHYTLLNVYNYWIYFQTKQRGPNEAVGYTYQKTLPAFVVSASLASGIPEDVLTVRTPKGYIVPEATSWDGSSYSRHHCYEPVAKALLDQRIPLSDQEREWCAAMLEHYTRNQIGTAAVPKATTRHEWAHYPVRTYVSIYQAFKALYREAAEAWLAGQEINWREIVPPSDVPVAVERWLLAKDALNYAVWTVYWSAHPQGGGKPRAVQNRNGDWMYAWDQSDPNNPEWHTLNQCYTERPWYVGLRASAWFWLWAEPDCPQWTKDLIVWSICEEARWCSRDWRFLPSLSTVSAQNDSCNGWIHGGFLPVEANSNRWIRESTALLTPDQWAALPTTVPYHPLTCLEARESDNGYFAHYWPTPDNPQGMERWHYPKRHITSTNPKDRIFGPRLDITGGSWAGMPDVLFLAGMAQGDLEKIKLSIWLCYDYLAFFPILYYGETLQMPKDKAARKWYGTAAGNSRAFYWTAMACGEVLRYFLVYEDQKPLEWLAISGGTIR